MEVKLQYRKAIGMYVLIKQGKGGDLVAAREKGVLERICVRAKWQIVEKWGVCA